MDDRAGWEIIAGHYLCPVEKPADGVLDSLSAYPCLDDYGQRIDSVLSIMDVCQPWLRGPAARRLADAAYYGNDAIDQQVEFYGIRVLPDQVRMSADEYQASDMEAISAFVLACAARALQALIPLLNGERGRADDWEWHRVFLESIYPVCECGGSVHLSLDANEVDACHQISELADDASRLAAFTVDGHRGAEERRQLDGTEARDLAIRTKALELICTGTKLHNLSSKLLEWQRRETGQALSKPQMNAILKRYNLHSKPSKK